MDQSGQEDGRNEVKDEEETQAQNKVVFGLLFLFMCYPAAFYFVWAFLRYTPIGAMIAAFIVFLFASYHTKLVNGAFLTNMMGNKDLPY